MTPRSCSSLIVFLIASSIYQGTYAVDVSVIPKEQIVREGEKIQMLCTLPRPLDFCRFQLPSGKSWIVRPDKQYPGQSYFGEGLEKGQCGVVIDAATNDMNGNFTCSLTEADKVGEVFGVMKLIVAKKPKLPELYVSKPQDPDGMFNEDESLSAMCMVKMGRPAANITWYLGDDKLNDGLGELTTELFSNHMLYTVYQNLTRRIQASDNGKELKCVAAHPLLDSNTNSNTRLISVKFAPKEKSHPLERFGLVEGEEGRISISVLANPKPDFTWVVGEENIYEGQQDTSGRFRVLRGTPSENKAPSSWDSVLVIDQLMKEDVERSYQLIARNARGEKTYTIMISTSPEPKMFELGAPAIVGIVVAVLVILTAAALLVFARAKGRWCFAESTSQFAGESSDTESADHHNSHPKVKKTPFTSVFKKKITKDPNEDSTTREANDDEKGEDNKEEAGQVMLNPKNPDEGVVYAELDLTSPATRVQVRPEDEKTEYAEIMHTKGK